MKRIHIVGRKNSGKTTLIVDLVTELTRQGYRVGTIKHTHHDHELDAPGKDSHRHREAGSAAVGILTRGMNAIFWPVPNTKPNPTGKYEQFDAMMQDCDIVLVEGDSRSDAPKVEVYRANPDDGETRNPIATSDPSILAVVTDDAPEVNQPIWPRDDLNSLVDQLKAVLTLSKSAS